MARDHGRILASIWADDDFTSLPPGPQRLYLFLLTQVDLSHAGVVAMRLRRWATRSTNTTVDTLAHDLQALADARFVVVDHDTEEVLVRTFIRNDGIWRQPNVMKAAVKDAREILSPLLRHALADELQRIPVHELAAEQKKGSTDPSTSPRAIVTACITELLEALGNPSPNPSGGVTETLPGTPPMRAFPPLSPSPTPSKPPADRAAVADKAPQTDDGAVSTGQADAPQADEAPRGSDARTAPSSPDPVLDIAEQFSAVTGRPIEDLVLAGAEASAQTLLADWIDACGARPPGRVIGHVARELKTMLDEGIPPDDVRAGLVTWHQRGLHPSALASVVHETRTAADRRPRDRQTDILRAEYAAAQAADAATTNQPLALGSTA